MKVGAEEDEVAHAGLLIGDVGETNNNNDNDSKERERERERERDVLLSLLSNRTKLTYAVELHEDDEPRERLPLGSEHLPCEALIARDGRSGLGLHALLHLGSCAKRKKEEFYDQAYRCC